MKKIFLTLTSFIFASFFIVIWSCGKIWAADNVEVYVAGKKFSSIDAYHKKQEQDAQEALNAAKTGWVKPDMAVASSPESEQPRDDCFDPEIGKTWLINKYGKAFISQAPIADIKTIEVKPEQVSGRVAGVNPSFEQLNEDFDTGKLSDGLEPEAVSSASQFEEKLRQKIYPGTRPVLLISDKKKVQVMELNDGQESGQEKAP